MFKPFKTISLALSLALLLSCALAEAPVIQWQEQAPSKFTATIYEFDGHGYVLYDHPGKSWVDAQVLCESYGGHLACVNSFEEQEFLEALLKEGTLGMYWLGGRRDATGQFAWLDGGGMDYSNWDIYMPDNHLGVENYMQMFRVPNPEIDGSAAFTWNDSARDNTIPGSDFFSIANVGFICEWEEVCHDFQAIDEPMTWEDAELYCRSLGGHLASIHSDEEQAAVAAVAADGSLGMYWLGGYRTDGDSFAWTDESAFDYARWDVGQPDNYMGIERFIQMYREGNPEDEGSLPGAWNDAPIDNTLPDSEFFVMDNVGLICETIAQPWVE